MKTKKELKSLFLTNSEKHEVHITSDGQQFWDKQAAGAHAKVFGLELETFTRDQVMTITDDGEALESIRARKADIEAQGKGLEKQWRDLDEEEEAILAKQAEQNAESAQGQATDPALTGDEQGAEKIPPAAETIPPAAATTSPEDQNQASNTNAPVTGEDGTEGEKTPPAGSSKATNKNGKK